MIGRLEPWDLCYLARPIFDNNLITRSYRRILSSSKEDIRDWALAVRLDIPMSIHMPASGKNHLPGSAVGPLGRLIRFGLSLYHPFCPESHSELRHGFAEGYA